MSDTIQIDDLARFLINEFGNIVKVDDMSDDLVFFYSMKVMNAQRAELAAYRRLSTEAREFIASANDMNRTALENENVFNARVKRYTAANKALAAALKELEGTGE